MAKTDAENCNTYPRLQTDSGFVFVVHRADVRKATYLYKEHGQNWNITISFIVYVNLTMRGRNTINAFDQVASSIVQQNTVRSYFVGQWEMQLDQRSLDLHNAIACILYTANQYNIDRSGFSPEILRGGKS